MLLVLTNSRDATADYLVEVLESQQMPIVRLDTDTLVKNVAIAYDVHGPLIEVGKNRFTPNTFRNVWYRRPEKLAAEGMSEIPEGRFALDEWTEALEGFLAHIPKSRWMNHPSANAGASSKLAQLTLARSLGLRVPDTILTQNPDTVRSFFSENEEAVVAKPLSGGYIERGGSGVDSLVYTNRIRKWDLNNLDDLPSCPTLFQKEIHKSYDLRVTFVDDAYTAVELRAEDADGAQRCDIRRHNMSDVRYRQRDIPGHVVSRLRRMLRRYDLRFAAIDMVVDPEGEHYFLEVNPNGQWAWLDLVGGMDIAQMFVAAFSGEHR